MMTIQLNTKKIYKVIFEQMETGLVFVKFIDADSAVEAGQKVMESVGVGYDLLISQPARKRELN